VTFLLYVILPGLHTGNQVTLSYSQFISDASAHKIKDVTFGSAAAGANTPASGTLTSGQSYTTVIPGNPTPALSAELTADGVKKVTAVRQGQSFLSGLFYLLILVLPFIFVFYLFRRMSRGTGSTLQGVLGVGRSRAKIFDAERPQTKFGDVAGYEGAKAEIAEVVDFLRNPERYRRAGAMAPRGVLMVGPPGTGKTLLARAVVSEAAVPFFSVSGSSFVEMFVGVGAARVRDLFAEARKRSPSSSSSTRSTPSASAGPDRARSSPTTSASRRSTSCCRRWTASTWPRASWCSARRTGPRCWTPRCSGRDGSTGRSSSRCPRCPSGPRSWPCTSAASGSRMTST
jgi:cell division protease FtsH